MHVGVDPKTVLCAHFKVGQCSKGDRCKYSHDLNVVRKVEKKNIYQDARTEKEGGDTMEDWNQEQLEKAITENESVSLECSSGGGGGLGWDAGLVELC